MTKNECGFCGTECDTDIKYVVRLFYFGKFEEVEICEDCARRLSEGMDENWDPITVHIHHTPKLDAWEGRVREDRTSLRHKPGVQDHQLRRCESCHTGFSPYFMRIDAVNRETDEYEASPYQRNTRYCRDCLDVVLGYLSERFGYSSFVRGRASVA